MQNWQYVIVDQLVAYKVLGTNEVQGGKRPLEDILNELGARGWEAVNFVVTGGGYTRVLLKREKQ